MNAMKSMVQHLMMPLKPSFYAAQHAVIRRNTHKHVVAGEITPLFKAALLIGTIGYGMEYMAVGKYHVADKQAIVKKALEGHAH